LEKCLDRRIPDKKYNILLQNIFLRDNPWNIPYFFDEFIIFKATKYFILKPKGWNFV
jgi:hypothetical protein